MNDGAVHVNPAGRMQAIPIAIDENFKGNEIRVQKQGKNGRSKISP